MLFKSEIIFKTWDTWMYYYKDIYYLYYLTSEQAPGDGFGVATSEDGIKWHDHGRVLGPSDKMVGYLGTGSVWEDADFARTQRFLCNYSEWRADGDNWIQNIFFAGLIPASSCHLGQEDVHLITVGIASGSRRMDKVRSCSQ